MNNVKTVGESQLISGKFHFFKNDIIYGKINPQLAKYVIAKQEGLSSADTYVLDAKNGVNQYFLFSLLQTADFYKYTLSVSMRTGMPKINREELNAYNFTAPKIDEQNKIGIFFEEITSLITANQRKLEKLQELKKGYLQKMFC
nr:restriction endonuclease subunit S [Liquorilactobacillus vini]